MLPSTNLMGSFNAPSRSTATGGTAFTALIKPFPGTGGLGPGNGKVAQGFSHVTKVIYTTGATAHLIGIMRPLNYTTFAAVAAAGQAVVTLAADPGLFATNWKYQAFTGTPSVANDALASGDYCAYQTVDGLWVVDTAASTFGTGGAVTMTTNVPTGGVAVGGLFYYFGLIGDTDPSTGYGQPQTTIAASQTRDASWTDGTGIVANLHPGDPMLFYSPNTTNQGWLEALTGYYSQF
jgi:hypothetical protein